MGSQPVYIFTMSGALYFFFNQIVFFVRTFNPHGGAIDKRISFLLSLSSGMNKITFIRLSLKAGIYICRPLLFDGYMYICKIDYGFQDGESHIGYVASTEYFKEIEYGE
jgi:hypothetical protein